MHSSTCSKSLLRTLAALAAISLLACRPQPSPVGRATIAGETNPDDKTIAEMSRSTKLLDLEGQDRRAIAVVSPQQLYDDHTRNRFAAESNYDGQFVKVVGPLVGMRRDDFDVAVLRLGLGPTYAPDAAINARFNLEDEGPLKELKLDQIVSVIGSPQYDAAAGADEGDGLGY